MILPGIPIQIEPIQQTYQQNNLNSIPIALNGGDANAFQIVEFEGDQQIRQQLIFRIRKNSKWFTGCNAYFTILLVINFINKVSLYNNNNSSSSNNDKNDDDDDDGDDAYNDGSSTQPNNILKASAVISMIQYIIWFLFIILAIHGITNNKIHLIRYYIKGLAFCIFLEILSNIFIFLGFGSSTPIQKFSYIIIFILMILILYLFIKNARGLLSDIESYKNKFGGNPITDQLNQYNSQNNFHNHYNQNMMETNQYANQGMQPQIFQNPNQPVRL